MRRSPDLRWAHRFAIVLLCGASVCCGTGLDSPTARDEDPPGDDDSGPLDGHNSDAGLGLDTDAAAEPGFADGGGGEGRTPEGELPSECYDGLDNDGDGAVDCDQAACRSAVASCCVGQVADECCSAVPGTMPALDFSACPDGGATSCLPSGVDAFGTPLPWIADGAFHPGGDLEFDSGFVGNVAIDLASQTVRLRGGIKAATDCDATCVESVGFGFIEEGALTRDPELSERASVEPLLGVLFSSSRNELRILVAGATVDAVDVEATNFTVDVDVSPEGLADVSIDGALVSARIPIVLERNAHVVGWGRNGRTSGMGGGASLTSLSVDQRQCEIPGTFQNRRVIEIVDVDGAPYSAAAVDSPSVAEGDGSEGLAFEVDARIVLAERPLGSGMAFQLVHPAGVAAIEGRNTHDERGVFDPELVWLEGEWLVFYTGRGTDDALRIGRAHGASLSGELVRDTAPVELGEAFRSASSPSIVVKGDTLIMSVEVEREDGTSSIEILESSDAGRSFTPAADSQLSERLGAAFSDLSAIGAAELVMVDGSYRVFAEARKGARYGVVSLASDDLRHFLPVSPAMVLAGAASFDHVSVRKPDAIRVGPVLTMVYVGFDGSEAVLAMADQPLPFAPR